MTISLRDQACIWHPLTQHQTASMPLPIVRGEGAYLIDESGKRYLDLISSWWVNLHGHSHPEIAKAIYDQAMTLEQVIFAGFTHEPAVMLAEELLKLLNNNFSKIFYSDNGSTAVEVALKMAYQYWHNQGEKKRRRFIAFERGYHGDTFGAMAVGKTSGYFAKFSELLFTVDMFPYPATWLRDNTILEKEQAVLNQLTDYLQKNAKEVAALIIEPLVQGAGGMQMCRPQFLPKLEQLMREYGVLIIYDEVMTGFGRTGDVFACLKANTKPDIICLSKGLTGGFLPLSVTACQEHIYQAFLGDNFDSALAHSHSFTANPLGCAAALASIKLLKSSEIINKINKISEIHSEILSSISAVDKPRYCGTIAAFDLKLTAKYGSLASQNIRELFLKRGLLIRPLGNVVYILPPYCVSEAELRQAYNVILEEIEGVTA